MFVDVGWDVDGALVHVNVDVIEMLVFFERKLACVESLGHRIAYLSGTSEQQRTHLITN